MTYEEMGYINMLRNLLHVDSYIRIFYFLSNMRFVFSYINLYSLFSRISSIPVIAFKLLSLKNIPCDGICFHCR